jgi:hypothetical protein
LEPNRDDEADERGRLRRQNTWSTWSQIGIKLTVLSFRGSSSPEEYLEWVKKLRRCLIGTSILTKKSVRWLRWSLSIFVW